MWMVPNPKIWIKMKKTLVQFILKIHNLLQGIISKTPSPEIYGYPKPSLFTKEAIITFLCIRLIFGWLHPRPKD